MLAQELKKCQNKRNIFVEIAYALQADKRVYRHAGGKVIFIGNKDRAQLLSRNEKRATPKLVEFIDKIPDLQQTKEICERELLFLFETIETHGTLQNLQEEVDKVLRKIQQTREVGK